MSTIHSPFSRWLITTNFPSIPIVFCWFSRWTAWGDADLYFSLLWYQKPMLLKEKVHQPHDYITNVINPYMWLMYDSGVTFSWIMEVKSHSNHITPKIITYHLHQTNLSWKLLHKCEKWYIFSSCVKTKSCKKELHKMRPAFT